MLAKNITFGLDEAGRGALAGPIFAAATAVTPTPSTHSNICSMNRFIEQQSGVPIRDSKKLTPLQRYRLFETIKDFQLQCKLQVFTSLVSVEKINQNGIGWANKQIFLDLIDQILNHQKETDDRRPTTERLNIIIDGNLNISHQNPNITIKSIPKADNLYQQVSLASIVAKVTRDTLMDQLHTKHPHYAWNSNKGYGTRSHINGLRSHGPCQHHRTQFVSTALKKPKAKHQKAK